MGRKAPAAEVVFFDLDGTLVDSAPDMAAAANRLRAREGLPPLPAASYRAHVGSGARGMLRVAFGLHAGDDPARYERLRNDFLDLYAEALVVDTAPFAGVAPLLDRLQAEGIRWGIVTNKALRLARPLVEALPLLAGHAVLVGGDSTPHTKPHPEPLRAAMRALGAEAERCVYVGDDLRDMQCGRAAGSATIAAAWGYLGEGADLAAWPADAIARGPGDVAPIVARLLHSRPMP